MLGLSTGIFGRVFTPEHIDALNDSAVAAVEVDWTAFLGALAAVGYGGPFLYEVHSLNLDPPDTLAAIERNFCEVIKPRMPAQ